MSIRTHLLLASALMACRTGSVKLGDDTVDDVTDSASEPSLEPSEEPSEEPSNEPDVNPLDTDDDGDGYTENDGDCDDENDQLHPGAADLPEDGIDQDCDGEDATERPEDADGDNYVAGVDCDDNNPDVNPGQTETPYDGIDNDCNSDTPDDDLDGDGVLQADDCDDENDEVFPGQDESPYDGIDNDCDPSTPDDDLDGDGFVEADDCDDNNSNVNPDAADIPGDGIDQDCSGSDAEPSADDADGDGYDADVDCDDTDSSINPGAEEVCDGIDNDCDGDVDSDDSDVLLSTWYLDYDGDQFGDPSFTLEDCSQPTNFVDNPDDCNDNDSNIYPGAPGEIYYDGIDQNCDGASDYDADGDGYDSIDWGGEDCNDNNAAVIPQDNDNDGVSGCAGDCDDNNPNVNPNLTEAIFDGVDNNCDGDIDNIDADDHQGQAMGAEGDHLSFNNGISVADFTRDGVMDLAVSAPLSGVNYQGKVYLLDSAVLTGMDADISDLAYAAIAPEHEYNWLGSMGQTQGDINGDGYADLAIGGSDNYNDNPNYDSPAGAIFLDPNTLSGDINTDDADIQLIDSQTIFCNARIETDVDYDGDGLSDVLFGDFFEGYWNGNATQTNADSRAYYLKGSDISAGNSYSLNDESEIEIFNSANYQYLGASLGAADFDGDGSDEVIIGMPGYDDISNNGGCVFVIDGGLPSNLLDQIELEHSIFLFGGGAAICSETENARFGWGADPQTGDYNGDGLMDLAIAAPAQNRVYVFFDAQNLSGLVSPEDDADVVIESSADPQWFGYAMATEDFNGDGMDDLVISAPDLQNPIYSNDWGWIYDWNTLTTESQANHGGIVFFYSGANLSGTMTDADADGTITSGNLDFFGMTLASGDLDGDGEPELVVGTPRYDGDKGRITLY